MMRMAAWGKREWPTLLIIAVGIAVEIFLVTRPFTFLLTNLFPDDAFYAFNIARHIAEGLGSTFDGINLTNGYHPLWIWILVPIFKWLSVGGTQDFAPIYGALALSVVLNAATAVLIARILTRFSQSPWIRAFGMVVWMLNPFLIFETLNGIETSLMLFFFTLFFLLALRMEEGKRFGGPVVIGIVGGLLVLARLDMALFVIALWAWMLFTEGKRAVRPVIISGAVAAVVFSPWLIWNYLTFHSIFTSASVADTIVNHALIYQDNGPGLFQTFKAVVYTTQYELVGLMQRTGMYSLALAFMGALATLYAMGSIRLPQPKKIPVTLGLFVGFIFLFIGNASIRWTVREWYFVSFDLFLAILAVYVLDRISPTLPWKRSCAALLFALTLFSFYVDWSKDLKDGNAAQLQMYAAAQWTSANLPPGTLVGVFNAGIQGYFSSARVINLDGLVNNAAYAAIEKRQLWQYVRNSHIAYIADFDLYLTYRYKSFFGADPYQNMTLVHSEGGVGAHGAGGLNIYRLNFQ